MLALATVITVLVATACAGAIGPSPISPVRSMMIGTWKSTDGALIILKPDGTFAARGLPANAGESSYGNVPTGGAGKWRVGRVQAEPPGVIFDFAPTVQMELLVERNGSSLIMYYDKGDPDEGLSGQYQFTRS